MLIDQRVLPALGEFRLTVALLGRHPHQLALLQL